MLPESNLAVVCKYWLNFVPQESVNTSIQQQQWGVPPFRFYVVSLQCLNFPSGPPLPLPHCGPRLFCSQPPPPPSRLPLNQLLMKTFLPLISDQQNRACRGLDCRLSADFDSVNCISRVQLTVFLGYFKQYFLGIFNCISPSISGRVQWEKVNGFIAVSERMAGCCRFPR